VLESADPKELATSGEIEAVKKVVGEYQSHWNDISGSIQKWLLATLITLNSGALLASINLGLHPDALADATSSFFLGLVFALLAGTATLVGISIRQSLILDLNYAETGIAEPPQKRHLRYIFKPRFEIFLAMLFGVFSIFQFSIGGATILSSTKPCSSLELEMSEMFEDNIVPATKTTLKTCYYYSLEGLSDDPWKRVQQEKRMLELLEENGISTVKLQK